MDYEPFDSSGTDDDLPPSHQKRIPRGVAGNGRSAQYPTMYEETDMEAQIHLLEQEAYSSVLRAFKAQADAITWEKESLITELRKELRLSNEEHRELLGKVNTDDVIRRIREWRQSGQVIHDPSSPSPSVSASCKNPNPNQPSSSAARRAPLTGTKLKNKKSMMGGGAGASSMKMQYPSSCGPTGSGRGEVGNRVTCDALVNETASLIGRKVRTRWPDDNNFYEAVITDYNPIEGRHALVYDIHTASETWEWVNLAEISAEDIQWEGEDPRIPYKEKGGYKRLGLGRGRGMTLTKALTRKEKNFPIPPSQNGIGKNPPHDIRLLHTDALIKEVERVFGSGHQDPLEIEKAKKLLKEHEQALADAIARLADISDGETATFFNHKS
ncbi:unnamed protein product [Lactuca virosa]|uniref:ENT domain-containing protein n=1 Tax=Lactuca virosa TaxID=75947 RepID=A0AAU9NMM7_9ASTR|nr:unnamed protein product [Lactuca virosa]